MMNLTYTPSQSPPISNSIFLIRELVMSSDRCFEFCHLDASLTLIRECCVYVCVKETSFRELYPVTR